MGRGPGWGHADHQAPANTPDGVRPQPAGHQEPASPPKDSPARTAEEATKNRPDREVRKHWIQRILDHDGSNDGAGGIEIWIRLGEACGLTRE